MSGYLDKLLGGDLRSEGRADEVARDIIENSQLLKELKTGLKSESKLLRARTSMTLEIISRTRVDLLTPIMPLIISSAAAEIVPQARWHLAEIFGRVQMSQEESDQVADILVDYLRDKSKIVLYCSIDSLLNLDLPTGKREKVIQLIRVLEGTSKSIDKLISQIL